MPFQGQIDELNKSVLVVTGQVCDALAGIEALAHKIDYLEKDLKQENIALRRELAVLSDEVYDVRD